MSAELRRARARVGPDPVGVLRTLRRLGYSVEVCRQRGGTHIWAGDMRTGQEHDVYVRGHRRTALRRALDALLARLAPAPLVGERVETPHGPGVVRRYDPATDLVTVDCGEEGGPRAVRVEELIGWERADA